MKYLTERTEIAKAMNFGKYPVLYINMEDTKYEDSDYCRGSDVRVHWDSTDPRYKDMYSHGTLYHSEGKLKIGGHGVGLHADFGRADVLEMCRKANTPMIHKGDTVVIVQDWPMQRMCKVRLMKMPNRMDRFSQVIATLEDIEEEEDV